MKTKAYNVNIELSADFETRVVASSKAEARKIAIERLNKKKPEAFIRKEYPTNRKSIDVYTDDEL